MTSRKRRPLSGALMRAFSERQFDSTLTTTSGETATAPSANRLTTDTSIPIFQTLSSSNWQQQQVPDLITSSDFRKTNATDVAVVHASSGSRVLRRALVHPDDESNRQLTRKSHSASLMTSSNGGQALKVCFGGSDVVGMAEMAPDGTKISPSAVSEDCSSVYMHHYRHPPTYDRANSINLSIASSTSVYRTPSGGTCSSMTTTTFRSSVDNRSIVSDRQSTPTVSEALPSKALGRSTFGQKSIKKMENRSDSEPRTKAELIRWRRVDNETIPLMPAVVSLDETVFPVPAHELVLSTSNFENGCNTRIESQLQLIEPSSALTEQPISPAYPSTAVKFKVAKSDMEICRHWERRQHSPEFTDGGGISSSASRTKTSLNDQTKFGVRRRQTRLRINVSGQHFEIGRNALARHPTTLLGDDDRRRRYYDMERDELFLDRHRPSFEAIFAYYQTGGRVRRPYNVPDDVFLAELTFYQLEPEVVDEYKRSEGYVFEQVPLPDSRWMRHVWMLFEYPDTSKAAFCVAVISVVITLVSIVLFCIETHEAFSTSHCLDNDVPNFADPFFVIETICTAWFTVEAIVRFVSCPSKFAFWRDFKNIVDVTAIIPYYVTLFNVLSTMSCNSAKSSASLSFLRVIRLVRVFKLTKHSVGLQILVMTFKASLEGLGLFLVALFVSLLVFSSAIYYAELGEKNTQMASIPDAFWWAIITMTTVGYGDKVPVGYAGRLVGAACAITGVLTLAIPVPIITGHFNRFYSHKTGRGRHV